MGSEETLCVITTAHPWEVSCALGYLLSSAAFLMFHVEQLMLVKECEVCRSLTLNHLQLRTPTNLVDIKTLLECQFL